MSFPKHQRLLLFSFGLGLLGVSLATRPLLPIDEARYLSVAWEMWLNGDFLVPHLNGQAYSDKPPLMFWLIHLGWSVFGVHEWWPRLLPTLFSLGSMLLTARLAHMLWPQRTDIAFIAAIILLSSQLWAIFATMVLFDIQLAFFVLLGIFGIVSAWGGRKSGWLTLGLAIGLGVLSKGPVMLLHVLPVAVLAPWWMREARPLWKNWYSGILFALLLGAVIAFAWTIPAAISGGTEYSHAVLWHQTADRMVISFAHDRPFWWYFPLLPLVLYPWFLWPPLWRALAALKADAGETGIRLCVAWMLPLLLAFSLIGGKQPHYLLPLFPAFALLASRALAGSRQTHGEEAYLPAGVLMLLGLVLLLLPLLSRYFPLAPWSDDVSPLAGALLVGAGMALVAVTYENINHEVFKLAAASVLLIVTLHFGIARPMTLTHDIAEISGYLKRLEDEGRPLAHAGKYYGQYQFLGRLRQPLEIIAEDKVASWLERHPDGKVVAYLDSPDELPPAAIEYRELYRGKTVAVLGKGAIARRTGAMECFSPLDSRPEDRALVILRAQAIALYSCSLWQY